MNNKDIKDATPEEIATHNRNAGYQLGAVAMRSLCVEKVKSLADSWAKSVEDQWDERPDLAFDAAERLKAAGEIITVLESLSIQEQKS